MSSTDPENFTADLEAERREARHQQLGAEDDCPTRAEAEEDLPTDAEINRLLATSPIRFPR